MRDLSGHRRTLSPFFVAVLGLRRFASSRRVIGCLRAPSVGQARIADAVAMTRLLVLSLARAFAGRVVRQRSGRPVPRLLGLALSGLSLTGFPPGTALGLDAPGARIPAADRFWALPPEEDGG
ncbi:hypothetical protein [Corallococcus sp. Z5C101001]|uniref:hypothetical protein n=1 Tax=Corallococcus sp. Z5C101001 TaxID=2596829 RepID=UPI00117F2AB9|nr:hypothetical protein [Corallococcus sp. Z5C101001]TSC22740.1 hypothetical protein FOF48_33055 [Corallococcus sp. Z5C101001]